MPSHLLCCLFTFCVLLASANGRIFNSSTFVPDMKVDAVSLAGETYLTNPDDVRALVILWLLFPSLREETDDPCLSPRLSWIRCTRDARPRVTALYLNDKNLEGYLPDFSLMDALEIIDLHDNELTGLIPSFLGTFPKLEELNLANNNFFGAVPDSIACNEDLKLSLANNPNLMLSSSCPTSSSKERTGSSSSPGESTYDTSSSSSSSGTYAPTAKGKKNNNQLRIILGCSISGFLLIWVIVGVIVILRQREKQTAAILAPSSKGAAQGEVATNNIPRSPTEEGPINSTGSRINTSP